MPTTTSDWAARDTAWAGVVSDSVTVDGVRVSLLRHVDHPLDSPEPDGAAPTLLLHGLGGHASNWIEVVPKLGARGPVVAVDLPGFGRTMPADRRQARPRALASFVPRLCATLGWSRVELHGNSMGGMVATMIAAAEPALVERLVLVAPALPAPRRDALKVTPEAIRQFAAFMVPGVGERLMRWQVGRSTPEDLVRESLPMVWGDLDRLRDSVLEVGFDNSRFGATTSWRIPAFTAATEELLRLMTRPRALNQAVEDVAVPTLLVWGDRDRLIGQQVIDGLRSRRPDWSVAIMETVGHSPQLEVPDRYLDTLDAWRDGL